jgi:hypothetical protein
VVVNLPVFLLSFKKIVSIFLIKVDGQMSRGDRDKCPIYPQTLIQYLPKDEIELKQPKNLNEPLH